MVQLSIVIPIFNVEKYIAECLDSVFHQDIPLSEYEVICVNDASPDNSREIVLDYMGRFSNLKLVEHEHNKKLGAARNTGRSIAQGKYIWNVDSDDYIKPNCLSAMLAECERNNLDILLFNAIIVEGDSNKPIMDTVLCSETTSGLSCLQSAISQHCFSDLCPIWKQLYKKSFLEKHHIFSPEINFGEDVPFTYKALILAQKVKVVNDHNYYYVQHGESLTGAQKVHSSVELYEKSIYNAHLIYNTAKIVPSAFADVKEKILSIASYTLQYANMYYHNMEKTEIRNFRKLCIASFFKDIWMINSLLSKRKKVTYIKNLFGLSENL